MERALQLSVEYAKTRQQFGRPIAEFQMVQALIAEMYVDVQAARMMSWQILAECGAIDETQAGRGRSTPGRRPAHVRRRGVQPRPEPGGAGAWR